MKLLLQLIDYLNHWSNRKIAIAMISLSLVFVLVGLGVYNRQPRYEILSRPKIAVTIFPLYDLARNVAGPDFDVVLILPPGANPHTYEPTPADLKKIAGSKLVFAIGHGKDDWSNKISQSMNIERVLVDKDIAFQKLDNQNPNSAIEPHYYCSIPNAMIISKNIKDTLVAAYPVKKEQIETTHNAYSITLAKLDQELRQKITNFKTKDMATFHGAWRYLAKDYGLNIVAELEEYSGKEPSPEYMKYFQDQVVAHQIKTIFMEPEYSSTPLAALASDLDVKIAVLDDLGGITGRESYVALMRYNLISLAAVME